MSDNENRPGYYVDELSEVLDDARDDNIALMARVDKLEAENERLRGAIMVHRVHCGHARRVDDSGFDRDLWQALEGSKEKGS